MNAENWHVIHSLSNGVTVVRTGETYAVMRRVGECLEMVRSGLLSDQDALKHARTLLMEDNHNEIVAAFLSDLTELTRKHGVEIGGCGCCGSPWLNCQSPAKFTDGAYRYDGSGGLKWE